MEQFKFISQCYIILADISTEFEKLGIPTDNITILRNQISNLIVMHLESSKPLKDE